MKILEDIIDYVGIDPSLKKILKGLVDIPYITDSYKVYSERSFYYPPMLVPLFVDYSWPYILGFIVHPFSKERTLTYIGYDLEENKFLEKARTLNQLYTLMILEMDMITESITPEILEFCSKIGYTNCGRVDLFAEEFGDIPSNFNKLPYFNKNTPLSYVDSLDVYDGNFVSSEKFLNIDMLYNSSSYEIYREEWLNKIEVPNWLNTSVNKETLAEKYISERDFNSAWFTINNEELTSHQVERYLKQIISLNQDNELLKLMANHWFENSKI